MEVAVADGAPPLADEGDNGRAAVAERAAPVVGEGGRDGVAVAEGGSRAGQRRRWWTEAPVADGGNGGG